MTEMRSSSTRPVFVAEYFGLLCVLTALVAFFGLKSNYFLSLQTLTAVVNQIPALTLVATGMTFVLISGGIDLSVGSVLALSSSVLGTLMVTYRFPMTLAVPAAILMGTLCGLVSGSVSVLAAIPSFIVSLGVLQIARGMSYVLTDSTSIYISKSTGIQFVGERITGLGISPAFLFAIGVVAVSQFVLHRTLFGRYCQAIGHNETVVRFSGIDTRWTRIGAFAVCGALAAVAGFVETSRLSAVDPNAAIGFELNAIAAAVIGGTSLMGGRGSMINTFIGVLIIAVLQAGLIQIGASEGAKYITTGCAIVLAVLLDASRARIGRFAQRRLEQRNPST